MMVQIVYHSVYYKNYHKNWCSTLHTNNSKFATHEVFDLYSVRNVLNSIMLKLASGNTGSNIDDSNDDSVSPPNIGSPPCGKAPNEVMESYVI
jgi:hypothetical protein